MEGAKQNFSLRPVAEDDFSKIIAIENQVHLAPWNEKHFRAELEKPYSQILVMTDDETDEVIAGYIVFWLMFEECQILNVVVDLPFRGRGFARSLVRKAVSLASDQSIKKVFLDVRKSNLPAIQLYQSVGFTITQVRKGHYSNQEDGYEMTLELDDCLLTAEAGIDF